MGWRGMQERSTGVGGPQGWETTHRPHLPAGAPPLKVERDWPLLSLHSLAGQMWALAGQRLSGQLYLGEQRGPQGTLLRALGPSSGQGSLEFEQEAQILVMHFLNRAVCLNSGKIRLFLESLEGQKETT